MYCYKIFVKKKDIDLYFNDSTYMNIYIDDEIILTITQIKKKKRYIIESKSKSKQYFEIILYFIFQMFSFQKTWKNISDLDYKNKLFQESEKYTLNSSQNEFLLILYSLTRGGKSPL